MALLFAGLGIGIIGTRNAAGQTTDDGVPSAMIAAIVAVGRRIRRKESNASSR